MEQYKDKAIEHVETNKKTKMKIVTDRQRVVYKLIEDGHWTRKYFTGVFTEVVNKFRWKNQKFLNSHIFYTTCKLLVFCYCLSLNRFLQFPMVPKGRTARANPIIS